MTTFCFVTKGIVDEYGSMDDFLRTLYACGEAKMASGRCWFVNADRRSIHVQRATNGEAYLNTYEGDTDRLTSTCPTSLIAAIVDWTAKKTVWRRDGVVKQVPAIKKKRRAKKADGLDYFVQCPTNMEDLGL